jgi:cysteinyl-tRNA synthetase
MGRDALMAADAAVNRLDTFHRRMVTAHVDLNDGDLDETSIAAFRSAMDDDFSTPTALDNAFSLIRNANIDLDNSDLSAAGVKGRTAIEMFSVLGIDIGSQGEEATVGPTGQQIEDLLEQRTQARVDKDFATADRIRDELASAGVVIEDSPNGVVWHRA